MSGCVDRPPLPGDPRFFRRTGPHTLAAVADAAEGEAPPRRLMLHRVAPLAAATDQDVSFCLNHRKNAAALAATKAAAVIVHPDMQAHVPEATVPILADDPLVAWAKVAALFHPLPPVSAGIHPSAVVAASARIDPSAEIGPLAVIGENVVIGPRGRIGAMAVIGDGVEIGRDARIAPQAYVSHALLGDRVYIYPGARIGQDGFGFAITQDGFHTIPQLGRVIIEDDVEVGANSTIDRGTLEDTVIGAGTRIDNLVQIGHNCRIGKACVLVAQSGIAGSTVLEDQVVVAAQGGIAGHLRIGTGARIGAQAGVMADVPARSDVIGAPAQPVKAFFREVALIRRWVRAGGVPGGPAGSDAAGADRKSNPDMD
ncbi:MAG TPA: UDP-3-O-(3-hydroxymyristoyl)glucosamine N-acyltransferase [Rhodopila sp.]|nr:UDP-3-O-(3-hydroxymyristoyl)glucosamine N-acyltransferase [Rhodopila sp.]